jgi:preprotein translocase subunit SecA
MHRVEEGTVKYLFWVQISGEPRRRAIPVRSSPAQGSRSSQPVKKKIGRNDPCPCGSGKKYKKCCMLKDMMKEKQKA